MFVFVICVCYVIIQKLLDIHTTTETNTQETQQMHKEIHRNTKNAEIRKKKLLDSANKKSAQLRL